jgi:hypothetical protein
MWYNISNSDEILEPGESTGKQSSLCRDLLRRASTLGLRCELSIIAMNHVIDTPGRQCSASGCKCKSYVLTLSSADLSCCDQVE